jgi:hypothetical protein
VAERVAALAARRPQQNLSGGPDTVRWAGHVRPDTGQTSPQDQAIGVGIARGKCRESLKLLEEDHVESFRTRRQ